MSLPGSDPERTNAPAGLRALGADHFSVADAVGGWRGLVESTAPGLVFVVVFVATRDLRTTLISSLAVAAIAVVLRLARRSPVSYALGGVLGVGIGAIWAWRSGEAQNYFAWGLITNAAMLAGVLVSLLARWPIVGIVASALGLGRRPQAQAEAGEDDGDAPVAVDAPPALMDSSWRQDRELYGRYRAASWLWAGAFALRLVVQVPIYLGGDVGWLGTARLVMGVPLWALVLWITWLLVRPRAATEGPAPAASSR